MRPPGDLVGPAATSGPGSRGGRAPVRRARAGHAWDILAAAEDQDGQVVRQLDRHDPTVNANGLIYGVIGYWGYIEMIDPKTLKVSEFGYEVIPNKSVRVMRPDEKPDAFPHARHQIVGRRNRFERIRQMLLECIQLSLGPGCIHPVFFHFIHSFNTSYED